MITVSSKWAGGHRVNHTPTYRVELWRTSTRLIADLKVESATVVKDASRYPRITANVSVADTSPSTAQLCTPFGNRLRFYAGIRYPDNTKEEVLVADLDIVSSRFNRPAGTLDMECADPSQRIAEDLIVAPYNAANFGYVQSAIQLLLTRTNWHNRQEAIDSTGTPVALPADWAASGDPWDSIEQLADSIGAECFFRPDRVPILQPIPAVKSTADATLWALTGGTVTAINSELIRSPNVVYVNGAPNETTGKFNRGVAYDNLSTSPTYIGGAYGRVVLVEDRPAVLSAAQANAAALALFNRVRWRTRTVTIDAVTDPAIEPHDTVQIRFAGGSYELHGVVSLAIPLGAEEMTVTCRSAQFTEGGWP